MFAALAAGAWAQQPSGDLTRISLEDLMQIQVTSVSRKEQVLSKAGAAIYVIGQEDIRRSGMTNIPDLLRLAPGVNVARISASAWAITVRGFNERYSSKTLVLIDGRSVYNQEFSGVFWDAISVPANGHTVWSLPATHTTEVFPACVGTVPLGDTAQYQNIGVASINTSSGAPVSITFQNAGDNTQVLYIRTTGK